MSKEDILDAIDQVELDDLPQRLAYVITFQGRSGYFIQNAMSPDYINGAILFDLEAYKEMDTTRAFYLWPSGDVLESHSKEGKGGKKVGSISEIHFTGELVDLPAPNADALERAKKDMVEALVRLGAIQVEQLDATEEVDQKPVMPQVPTDVRMRN